MVIVLWPRFVTTVTRVRVLEVCVRVHASVYGCLGVGVGVCRGMVFFSL